MSFRPGDKLQNNLHRQGIDCNTLTLRKHKLDRDRECLAVPHDSDLCLAVRPLQKSRRVLDTT